MLTPCTPTSPRPRLSLAAAAMHPLPAHTYELTAPLTKP